LNALQPVSAAPYAVQEVSFHRHKPVGTSSIHSR
jgi:hypothetical protein